MHPFLSLIPTKGPVGDKLKEDLYGDFRREYIDKIEMNIRELQLLIDSNQLASSEMAIHFQALDALYAAREAVESISSMLSG